MSSELYKIVKKISKKRKTSGPCRDGTAREGDYLRKVSTSTITIGTPMRTK